MTLESISVNMERWKVALRKAQDAEIRLQRRLDIVRHRRERLEAKIKKYGAYASYYKKGGGKMKSKIITMVVVFMMVFGWVTVANADDLQTAGDFLQVAIPAVGFIATLGLEDKEGTKQLAKSLGSTIAVTYAIKYSLNTKRPNGGDYSFPSGHTGAAFAGAGFIQQRYGWEYGVPAYALASFVGYSRIHSKNHYWYDVLGGAAIGIGSNLIFTNKYKKTTVAVTPVNRGAMLVIVTTLD